MTDYNPEPMPPQTHYYGAPSYGAHNFRPQPGNPLAVAGFVTGLLGLIISLTFVFFFIAGPLSVVGISLSAVGIKRSNDRGAKSRGLGIAGLVLGILGGIFSGFMLTMVLATL